MAKIGDRWASLEIRHCQDAEQPDV